MKHPTIKLLDPDTGKRQRILYSDYQANSEAYAEHEILDAPAGTPEHSQIVSQTVAADPEHSGDDSDSPEDGAAVETVYDENGDPVIPSEASATTNIAGVDDIGTDDTDPDPWNDPELD